jgi:uncharacterized protein (TIGR03067 family)
MAVVPLTSTAPRGEAERHPQPAPVPLEDSWDEPELPDHVGRTDLEGFQGTWRAVAAWREVEFLVCGGHFTIRFQDGDIYMGAFDLDPTARPKVMEMRIEEGPARHKGKTAVCIYHLDGDTLRWCTSGPGQGERLSAFPVGDDPRYLGLLFKRER